MKGILYSMIAALMLIPLFTIIFYYSHIGPIGIDTSIRADELKYFADSVQSDLMRFVDITGKRSLISAVSNVTVSGIPLDNATKRMAELVENGTIQGVPSPLVDVDNLNSWTAKVKSIARNSGFNLTIKKTFINVTQHDSFDVLFEVEVEVNVSDDNMKMGVLRNISANGLISLNGIEDPLMPLNTIGRATRSIRQYDLGGLAGYIVQGTTAAGSASGNATLSTLSPSSQKILITNDMTGLGIAVLNSFGGVVSEGSTVPVGLVVPYIAGATNALSSIQEGRRVYLDFQTRKVWDLQNLTSFVKGGYYLESDTGPSFLDRLEGRLSNTYGHGIETILNLQNMTSMGLVVNYSSSCVDYRYFGNVSGNSVRSGNYDPIFNWLKIDQAGRAKYGVDEL